MNRPGQPVNERVAVVEEKVDALTARLEQHEAHIHGKLDLILANQGSGSADRADLRTKLETMASSVESMKPHVQTVSDAKVIWRAVLVLSAISGSIAASIGVAWGYIKPIIVQTFWK